MWIVWVTEGCKNTHVCCFSSGHAVDKPTCEECEFYEPDSSQSI